MIKKSQKRPVDATHLGNSYSPDLKGRRDTSIFSVDLHWRREAQPLPSFLVTEPTVESALIEDTDDLYTTPHGGRYPVILFPEEAPKPLSATARSFAQAYYHEGLATSAQDNLGKRIDCFRAAELLYLHAASRGDVRAHVGLGLIYAHDHGEGHYFDALSHNLFLDAVLPTEEIERKAHYHLKLAAAHDDPEGIRLYGDTMHDGRGCAIDREGALACYRKALHMLNKEKAPSPALRGMALLRLGRAYEGGEGCDHDFATALKHYEDAAGELEDAIDCGLWYYDVELGQAIRGVKRMRQEITLMKAAAR